MATFLLIIGALASSYALVMAFMKPVQGAIAAYFGAWALMKSGFAPIPQRVLLFWAVIVILVVGIQMIRGRMVRTPFPLRAYVAGGALAFTAVGTLIGQGGMVLGAVAGVLLGAIAFMRLKGGAGNRFWPSVVAVGAPTVVTMVLVALSVVALMAGSGTIN